MNISRSFHGATLRTALGIKYQGCWVTPHSTRLLRLHPSIHPLIRPSKPTDTHPRHLTSRVAGVSKVNADMYLQRAAVAIITDGPKDMREPAALYGRHVTRHRDSTADSSNSADATISNQLQSNYRMTVEQHILFTSKIWCYLKIYIFFKLQN